METTEQDERLDAASLKRLVLAFDSAIKANRALKRALKKAGYLVMASGVQIEALVNSRDDIKSENDQAEP